MILSAYSVDSHHNRSGLQFAAVEEVVTAVISVSLVFNLRLLLVVRWNALAFRYFKFDRLGWDGARMHSTRVQRTTDWFYVLQHSHCHFVILCEVSILDNNSMLLLFGNDKFCRFIFFANESLEQNTLTTKIY